MLPNDFERLCECQEGPHLDFKSEMYVFEDEDADRKKIKRAKFVKDIISMANTVREAPAHIVLGVKAYPDGTKDFIGIQDHIDDAVLQDKLAWVHPRPQFTYEPLEYSGKIYGLITIPPYRDAGPFFYTERQAVGNLLRPNQLYIRRGSQNGEATDNERKIVFKWFLGKDTTAITPFSGPLDTWDGFTSAVDNFDHRRSYGLVLTPLPPNESSGHLAYVGDIDWLFVADLDHKGLSSGAYSHTEASLKNRRALHPLTLDDDVPFSLRNATYWYFTRGIEKRGATLATGSWLDWYKKYIKHLRRMVSHFASVASFPQTFIVFVYSTGFERHIQTILEAAVEKLPDSMEIVFVSASADDDVAELASRYDASHFPLPLHHLLSGLHQFAGERRNSLGQSIALPSNTGVPIAIEPRSAAWIEEEMELVHINIGNSPSDVTEDLNDYRKGKTISWFDLALRLDIERDDSDGLEKKVRRALDKRRVERLNLFHEPGAGGTTVARRLLWNLRKEYPCVIIQSCSDPQFTNERIEKIYSLTKQPVLVVTDGNTLSDTQSNTISALLSSRNVPATILQVTRLFTGPPRTSKHSVYLKAELSDSELSRIKMVLCRDVPGRKEAIGRVGAVSQEKTLFYLGLVAFEEEFVSLDTYVERHIQSASPFERQIVMCLALAHYYGQESISAQYFAGLLDIPLNKVVELERALNPSSLNLLIRDGVVKWRPLHYLISQKILEICLTPEGGDRRAWKTHLSRAAREFIEICSGDGSDFSNEKSELFQSIFINRSESEVTGRENSRRLFARIIEDVPNNEGKLSLFNTLTETFPEEHHYWAHMGRFYATKIMDYEKAISALNKALAINDQDHVVLHMKGMALRKHANALIADNGDCETIIDLAEAAAECFEQARAIAPDSEHGYISEIQLIIEILGYYGKSKDKKTVLAAAESSREWVRECFGRAENLLLEVRIQKQGEELSQYEAKCRADLDILYGNRGEALQIWQNLLDRRAVYAPPIRRQLVYTLLSGYNRSWGGLKQKEALRCVDLLRMNMNEEPIVEQNLRLWLHTIRMLDSPPPLENILEKVAYWGSVSNDINAAYYQYILYMLLVMTGSNTYLTNVDNALNRCQTQAKYHRNRTKSFEWVGSGSGIKQLVNQRTLGEWNRDANFWNNPAVLARVEGVITKIRGPQSGTIEFNEIEVFFVPGISSHARGESENMRVSFYLGFSYDGPRAWGVEDITS